MSAFAIYAYVITGLYVISMAVIMLMDLFMKKDRKEDFSEEFNNSGMVDADDDSSSVVDETSDGYSVRHAGEPDDNIPDTEEEVEEDDEEPSEVVEEELVPEESADEDDILEQESLESLAEYESLKAVQAQMDAVTPSYQGECRSDDFAVLMAQPIKKKSRILRNFVDI